MKDIIKCLVLTLTLLNACVVLASCTETTNVVKWTYEIVNGGVVLGGRGKTAVPKDTSGGLVIPDKIDGKPVCGIGERAFEFCRGLASVEIPLSVTNIVRFAFRGCSGLKSVNIPSRVASIGDFAFCECSGLKSVTIPSSVTNIGEDAFLRCCELEAFFVDGKNTAYCSIDSLLYDKNMRLISCPAGKIGAISLPSGVKDIGGHAFYWCGGLTSVSIPSGVANIGAGAFWACRGLKSVTIPEGVTNIENMAFGWCDGLTSVVMPSSVTRIGFGAFECCSNLTAATIPSNVTSIDLAVFARCSQLNAISVDTNNSAYCSVDGLLYDKSMKLISCPEGKTGALTLPQGVTSIGSGAFGCCCGLTSVMIPSSVTNIEDYVFYDCSQLNAISVDTNNLAYCSVDGLLYDRSMKLISCPGARREL